MSPKPTMLPPATQPAHSELVATKSVTINESLEQRDAAVEAAKKLIIKATDAHTKLASELEAAHEAELQARIVAAQQRVQAELLPLCREAWATPSRATTAQIAAAFRTHNAECERLTGRGLEPLTIALALAALSVEQDPSLIATWIEQDAFTSVFFGVAQAAGALHAALCKNADVIELHNLFEALEVAMSRRAGARSNALPDPDLEAKWSAVRFSGSRHAAAAAIEALEKPRRAAIAEAAVTRGIEHQAQQARRGLGWAINGIAGLLG